MPSFAVGLHTPPFASSAVLTESATASLAWMTTTASRASMTSETAAADAGSAAGDRVASPRLAVQAAKSRTHQAGSLAGRLASLDDQATPPPLCSPQPTTADGQVPPMKERISGHIRDGHFQSR
jgi:hypothetical protein